MENQVLLGDLNCERFWRPNHLACLPEISDPQGDNIVLAMDELLLFFAGEGDLLATRFSLNEQLIEYLATLELSSGILRDTLHQGGNLHKSTCELLLEAPPSESVRMWYAKKRLEPFAYLTGTRELCDELSMNFCGSSLKDTIRVNSKIYSKELKDKLGIPSQDRVIRSAEELEKVGLEFLRMGPFVLKDAYGVSGKGNMLVASDKLCGRLAKHFIKQEQEDKKMEFVAEPFLHKKMDFSCQMKISSKGNTEIICVHRVVNNGFAYRGSTRADEKLMEKLEQSGYLLLMRQIGSHLYTDGYIGDVCVDSMLLVDGTLVPLVEINARKSMSLIHHHVEKHLSGFGQSGLFTFFSLLVPGTTNYRSLLDVLNRYGILFAPQARRGILPLSANTVTINGLIKHRRSENAAYKARLYAFLVGAEREWEVLRDRVREALNAIGVRLVSV